MSQKKFLLVLAFQVLEGSVRCFFLPFYPVWYIYLGSPIFWLGNIFAEIDANLFFSPIFLMHLILFGDNYSGVRRGMMVWVSVEGPMFRVLKMRKWISVRR